MPDPIRYEILDEAIDQPALWHLTYSSHVVTGGESVELYPARTVEEIRPHLADLLREGHIEVFPFRDPESPHLPLDQALDAVTDDSNWNPETADTWYGVITTDSGMHELRVERESHDQAT